jgi:membrane protein required for colicin V production
VLNLIFLGWLDHLLGAVLGFVQMLLLLEAILLVAWFFPVPNLSDNVHTSALAMAMLRPLSGLIEPLLPPEFQLLKLIHPLP